MPHKGHHHECIIKPIMKVVISPQTFRGGLPGVEAANAIKEGVNAVFPGAETVQLPVADGGDGTLDALVGSTNGEFFTSTVTGPLKEPIHARWGVMGDGTTAVIEMARASGLALLPPSRRNPKITTTYGTGELISLALDKGYRQIIVGLGGSATNDGGAGMAQALGVNFLDSNREELPSGGAALSKLSRIEMGNLRLGLSEASITAAADVINPLCGPTGAAVVYGPQKGASPETVKELDKALDHYSQVIKRNLRIDVRDTPGSGAAGGMGAGMMAFLDAQIRPGIDLVCDVLGVEEHLVGADLVITGEGRVDASTAFDKAPVGLARRAKARGIPVIAFAGSLGPGYEGVYELGIDGVIAILDRPMRFEESLSRSYSLLRNATERTMRLIQVGGSLTFDR